MSKISYIIEKKVLDKRSDLYVLDLKKFSNLVVDVALELNKYADEEEIKKAIDVIIENIKQNYKDINFKI